MIFTRFRSSWFYARIHLVSQYATTSITVSKLDCTRLLFFSPFQGTSYFFPLYFHLSVLPLSFSLFFFFFSFSPSQSFVLSTPTDIEFSSRRINFFFFVIGYPILINVSICFFVLALSFYCSPHAFHIPASHRPFLFLPSRIRLPSHFSILPARNPPDTDPIMNIQISRRGLAVGRWRATRDTKI